MPSRRRNARIAVMQTLFEWEFRGGNHTVSKDAKIALLRNLAELGGEDQTDIAFAGDLLQGILEHGEDIRHTMAEHAPQWPLERMDGISRALLMVGTYELLFGKDAPPAVVMNEAIDIAKEFGEGESGKFVNGVLNAIAHAGK